jgi:tRNA dimethylallyltransferase
MNSVAASRCTLEAGVELLKRNTRNYAKRQMTWFKKDTEIRWFYPEEKDGIIEAVRRHLA